MLIDFRFENHRSIRDEQVFTMRAGRIAGADDERLRAVAGFEDPIVPAAALYGANASGKSNVLAALSFMRAAVVQSHRAWLPSPHVPRDAFAWGPRKTEPSLFEVHLVLSGVRYEYGFVADDECFLEEWLHSWGNSGRKQQWFHRERGRFKFGAYLRGENQLIEQVTRPNALFLSAAVQHRHEQLQPLYEWFHRIQVGGVDGARGRRSLLSMGSWWRKNSLLHIAERQADLFGVDPDHADTRDAFRDLLRAADVGIEDFKVVEAEATQDRGVRLTHVDIRVKHKNSSDEAWLPVEEESGGTRMLFRLGPPILEALRLGALLVVDELEASLHPLLAIQILKQFNSAESNKRNAQLLFTTHDTALLGSLAGTRPLRRDQIWLTEKDGEGATTLYPLTDYKPRNDENIERGYLQGRYGAIPFLEDLVRAAEE